MNTFTNLIKSAVVLLIATAGATQATAQIHFEGRFGTNLNSVPGSLQCDGQAKLFVTNAIYYSQQEVFFFKLLDENLQVEREFTYTPTVCPSKTVYQERKVNGYTEDLLVYDEEENHGFIDHWETGKSLEEFCQYYNALLESDFGAGGFTPIKPEDLIIVKEIYFLPYNDKPVKVPTIDEPTFWTRGMTYNPQNGLVIGGEYYRYAKLSEEWETVKEEESISGTIVLPLVDFENLATGIEKQYTYISQNFFNNDEKYEFIVPTYVQDTEGYIRYTNYLGGRHGEEEYVCAREVSYSVSIQGYDVINEDGKILFHFDVNPSENIRLFKFNNKNYIEFEYRYYNNNNFTNNSGIDIYEIDTQTSDIKMVQQLSGISIQPRTPQRNEPIAVELLEKEADTNLDVIVTSANGRVVQRATLRAGDKGVSLNTSRLDAGFYNVTVLRNGQKVENAKVIVR